jgi:hypothetical protein
MPAINFKREFAYKVECGDKKQTIRAKRARPFKPGDELYLFTGMRQPGCRRLRHTRCESVDEVFIDRTGVMVGNRLLPADELAAFAKADGFDSAAAFIQFFKDTHGLPFSGQLVRWL